MATAAPKVEELVTCSICLEKMTRPKMLPCQHTFCLSCLMSIPRPQSLFMDCPQCRTKHNIPTDGIKDFSDNFLINSLLGILEDAGPVDAGPEEVKKCSYCQKDVLGGGVVCPDCATDPRVPVMEKIGFTLAMMKSNLSDPSTLGELEENDEYHASISTHLTAEKEKICAKFDGLIDSLQKRKSQLSETFDRGLYTHNLMRSAIGDRTQLEAYYKNCTVESKAMPDLAYLKLLEADCSRYLNWFKQLMEVTRCKKKVTVRWPRNGPTNEELDLVQVLSTVGQLSLEGSGLFDEEGKVVSAATVASSPQASQQLNSLDLAPASCSLEDELVAGAYGGVKRSQSASSHKQMRQEESLESLQQRLESQLMNLAEHSGMESQRMSQARSAEPTKAGGDAIVWRRVDYYDKAFKKPFCIRPRKPRPPIQTPSGVAYAPQADMIIVADSRSDRIDYFRPSGTPVTMYNLFGPTIKLSYPWDVGVSEANNIVVISDSGNYRIVCQDMQGNVKYTTGGEGRGRDKFLDIRGITCHKDFILAVDGENRRVSVFKIENGEYVRNFGQKYLTSPQYITVSMKDSSVYVTDSGDVLVFDWNGRFLRKFGPRAGLPAESRISGITVDSEGYVCIGRLREKCLDVYDRTGAFATCIFGGLGFAQPRGMALMPDGRIIVCDAEEEYNSSQLQIL